MAEKPKMQVGNVVVYNKSLDCWKRYVAPFIDKYVQENSKYPTWNVLETTFKGKLINDNIIKNEVIIKTRFRSWLSALIRRYRDEYVDETANVKKKNSNYSPVITTKLQERFDAISAISPPPVRGEIYSEDDTTLASEL